jgi:putative tricarboxylic transport membrane protein
MVAEPFSFACLVFGVWVGIMFGAMPGLSVNMGLALLLPLAFAFKGISGILMLLGIYCGAIYGGSISAILLKTPGTPASVATTLDGYPLATKLHQPGRALGISTMASTFGGIFSTVCLIIMAPLLAKVALQFSKPEYFALAVFGLSIITSVSSGNVIKGVMGGVVGLFLATIGIDAMSGMTRFTFGTNYLLGGVSFIPILIGVFALAQVLQSIEDNWKHIQQTTKMAIDRTLPRLSDVRRVFVTLLRSSAIGTFIGCIPGTGGDIASFVAYDQAKRWSRHKDNFGKGEPEGVAAPEAGNNAVSGGAFIPVLTLGIPGDGATAIMMGALMVQGIQPGPMLFMEKAPYVYAIFLGLLLANVVMCLMGYSLIRLFAKVTQVPNVILLPLILVMTFVGTYSYNNSMNDVFVMVGSGILGYFLNKLEFSMSSLIIGIILGAMAEQNFVGSLIMSDGSLGIFFSRPLCLFFLVAAAIMLVTPLLAFGKKKKV